ncbi:MAG: flavodoxin family protein [Candidatus Cloacimonetes bacterium]|nr:flavodoxin family protein [Candidatus Cloacimonadota bacterium]
MKVLAINSSPRPEGNTKALLQLVCKELNDQGIDTEIYQLGGKLVHGCMACRKCFENQDRKCVITGDCMNELISKVFEADGLIIGSPTYFSNVTTELKAFIDRAGYVTLANGNPLRRKAGAAVVAVRRAGSLPTFDAINHFYFITQMVIPGSSYWNIGIGREQGEVLNDAEGIRTMETLGKNMAWLMHKLNGLPISEV